MQIEEKKKEDETQVHLSSLQSFKSSRYLLNVAQTPVEDLLITVLFIKP